MGCKDERVAGVDGVVGCDAGLGRIGVLLRELPLKWILADRSICELLDRCTAAFKADKGEGRPITIFELQFLFEGHIDIYVPTI